MRHSDDFAIAAFNTFVAVAVLAQVGVAAVVAARARSHRGVLVPLTVCLTATLSGVMVGWVVIPVARCADLSATTHRPGAGCLVPTLGPAALADIVHWVAVKGVVVAVPAVLLGVAVGALRRWRHPPVAAGGADAVPAEAVPARAVPAHAGGRRGGKVPAAVAVLLVAVVAATGFGLPGARHLWLPAAVVDPPVDSAPPADPVPPAETGSVAPCVVGTWVETSNVSFETVGGATVRLTSEGAVQRFRVDGTGVMEYGTGHVITGTIQGQVWEFVVTGTVRFDYAARDGKLLIGNLRADGTITVKVDGVAKVREPLQQNLKEDGLGSYTCEGDTMQQTWPSYSVSLRRTSHTA